MLPVWPKINYFAELGSWAFKPSNGKSRATTDMDNGRVRSRRRFSSVIAECTFRIDLTDVESDMFMFFYQNVLRDGTGWFTMPVFTGTDYVIHTVRFKTDFEPEFSNTGFQLNSLSVSLEINKLQYIDEDTYYYYANLGVVAGDNLDNELEKFVDTYYPKIVKDYK